MGFFSKKPQLGQSIGSPQIGQIVLKRNELGIEPVFTDSWMFDQVWTRAAAQFQLENMRFLTNVRHYRTIEENTFMRFPIRAMNNGAMIPRQYLGNIAGIGKYIYDRYILRSANETVNINDEMFQELYVINQTPGHPFTSKSFDKAYAEISKVTMQDVVMKIAEIPKV